MSAIPGDLLSVEEREQRRLALEDGRARAPEVVGRERDGAASEALEFAGFPETKPLIVVVADSQDFGDQGSQKAHRELWIRLSEQWLDLSTRGELVIAKGSGHMIHQDRPQMVVDAIERLVEAGGVGPAGP